MTGHQVGSTLRRRLAGGILGWLTIVALAVSLWWLGPALTTPPTTILSASITTSTAVTTFPATATRPTATATLPTTTATLPTTTATLPATTATLPATTATPPTTTATPPTTGGPAPLVMSADGLGVVRLGDPYDDTVEAVTDHLGRPDHDSGWIRSDSRFGTCPGTIVRVVQWHSLRLFFSDGPTEFGQDIRHFFYYNQSMVDTDEQVDLTTDRGIRLGSTVRELRRAYGQSLTIDDSLQFGISFMVDTAGSSLLSGTLTSAFPQGLVTSIAGGFGCGG